MYIVLGLLSVRACVRACVRVCFPGLVLMCVYCPGASVDVCILFWA